jgi:hypothetical protein
MGDLDTETLAKGSDKQRSTTLRSLSLLHTDPPTSHVLEASMLDLLQKGSVCCSGDRRLQCTALKRREKWLPRDSTKNWPVVWICGGSAKLDSIVALKPPD